MTTQGYVAAVAGGHKGIPQAEQQDLFTRFFRSSTAQEHAIQGTGLGLTIVDSIVHNHGGDISVVSEHLDARSTRRLDLRGGSSSWRPVAHAASPVWRR